MKKQILFLAMFTIALIFAGTNDVFGQLLPGVTDPTATTPQPIAVIDCETNALPLHPVPGVPFTYTMTNGTGATSANWTWWATKDPDFVKITAPATTPDINLATQLTVASGALISTGMSGYYGTDNRGGTNTTENSVTINWSAATLAGTSYQGLVSPGTPTFVVGYSEGLAGCTDNLQVFEINPMPNFTIDIAAIDATGATLGWDINTEEQCVDEVQSATYSAGEITVDYGTNSIYYEVAAKNFVNDFAPSFMIMGGLLSDQTATISIYASYSDASNPASTPLWSSAAIVAGGMNTIVNSSTSLTATNIPDIATGVSFFVKVVIDNNTEESLANNPFILAVDAYDNTNLGAIQAGVSTWDMESEDCAADPDVDDDQVDNATITITPRPTMQMDGDAMSEPSTVNPEDVINKL